MPGFLDSYSEKPEEPTGFLGQYSKPGFLQTQPQAQPEDPFGSPSRHEGFGDLLADFIADQLDPLNLLMLGVGAGLAGQIGKAFPLIAAGSKLLPRAGTAVVESTLGRRFLHHAAKGLGWTLPFASVELFETPEKGETRVGDFFQSMLFMTVADIALLGLVTPLMGSGAKEAFQEAAARTFNGAVERGVQALDKGGLGLSKNDAITMAMTDMLQTKVKGLEDLLGADGAAGILETAREIARMSPEDLAESGLRGAYESLTSAPGLPEAMSAFGLPVEAFAGIPTLLRKEALVAAEAQATAAAEATASAAQRLVDVRKRVKIRPEGSSHDKRPGATFRFVTRKGQETTRDLLDRKVLKEEGELRLTTAAMQHFTEEEQAVILEDLKSVFELEIILGKAGRPKTTGGSTYPTSTLAEEIERMTEGRASSIYAAAEARGQEALRKNAKKHIALEKKSEGVYTAVGGRVEVFQTTEHPLSPGSKVWMVMIDQEPIQVAGTLPEARKVVKDYFEGQAGAAQKNLELDAEAAFAFSREAGETAAGRAAPTSQLRWARKANEVGEPADYNSADGRFEISKEFRRLGGEQWILRDKEGGLGPLGRGFPTLREAQVFAGKRGGKLVGPDAGDLL